MPEHIKRSMLGNKVIEVLKKQFVDRQRPQACQTKPFLGASKQVVM
jgi:hypothetical protein